MTQIHQVGIKLLHPDTKIPTKANETDSCYDVVAVRREALFIEDFESVDRNNNIYGYKYHLGFALDLPPNTELQIRSRSSIFKTGLILSNGIGTGDEGYTGEYSIVFYHVVPELPPYEVGDRIAQIQVANRADIDFNLVEELPDKDRDEKGWGSSGVSSLLNELYPESESNIAEISRQLGEAEITSAQSVYTFPSEKEYKEIGE